MQNQTPRPQYKYLTIISMIYITIMLAGNILTYKFVHVIGITMIAGSFLTPTWFIISDIVTEVYGYAAYRQLIWQTFICSTLFTVLCFALAILPPPLNWNHQPDFDYIILKLPRILISGILGILIASFLNSYAISKWKILTRGKYFWIRSVISSSVAELIFTIITMSIVMFNTVPFIQIVHFILISYGLKLLLTASLAVPSVLVADFLKRNEGIDIYDHQVNFNPFKLKN